MIINYERNKIYDFIGPDSAKTSFTQQFPKMAKFDKTSTTFYTSGIFQLTDGPCILILPWFYKDIEDSQSKSGITNFLDTLNEINEYKENFINLKSDSNTTALDIIFLSNLKKLNEVVKKLVQKNHHVDETENITSIKGKWHIEKDLLLSDRPLSFTCSYGNVDINTPIMQLFKSYLCFVKDKVRTTKNHLLIDETLKYLSNVDSKNISVQLLVEAKSWSVRLKEYQDLIGIFDFIETLMIKKNIYAENAGVALTFRLDKFFEKLVENIVKTVPDSFVAPQTREDLLGGGVWSENNSSAIGDESLQSHIKTIPDIIVDHQNNFFVLECKYKPLKIPFINNDSNEEFLISLDRSDRNQMLSFVLSLRPSSILSNKNIYFSIVFPCSSIESFKVSTLSFESAKLYIDPIVRNLIQNKSNFNFEGCLKIRFVAVNILHVLKEIKSSNKLGLDILNEIIGNDKVVNLDIARGESKNKINRRLALASMIVKRNENEQEFGKVKLAKLIFLADAHLNLDIGANYVREAAGPLDYTIMYNENVGLESLAAKNSLFYITKVKRENSEREKTKYSSGVNLENYLNRFAVIYPDKGTNIINLLDKLNMLDYTQLEIISTIYACWNDMKFKNIKVDENSILNEFLNNWHDSKKDKFDNPVGKSRILKAFVWMKDNDLVPDGIKILTKALSTSKVSSF